MALLVVLSSVLAQTAVAAVSMNALTDGTIARSVFKPGDTVHASGSVDGDGRWSFVVLNGTTEVRQTPCSASSGAVSDTYLVTATDAEGAWTYELRQWSGDNCDGSPAFTDSKAFSVDKTVPTATSIERIDSSPTNASSVSWTVTFSESVTGVDAGDFDLAPTDVAGASITDVTGTGATRTVTASSGSGSGTLGVDLVNDDTIVDGVGNALAGGLSGQSYTIDKTAPTVTSIDRAGASPTNAGSVAWTVTFSEDVTGVGAADFALDATGVSDPAITNVTGTGNTRTVTADTGTGDGTLALNLVDDESIADGAGNTLATGLTGQTYTIKKSAPTVTSIDRADSDPTNDSTVAWTVTFSENVTGVDADDFALVATGVTGAAITGVTGSGDTRTVTADTGTGTGTIGLNLVDDDSIVDATGNTLAGTADGAFTGEEYTLDRTAPATTHSFSQPAPTDQVTVTLSSADPDVAKTYFAKGTAPVHPAQIPENEYDPADKPKLANGEKIKYFSVDAVGNVEAVHDSAAAVVRQPSTSGRTGGDTSTGGTSTTPATMVEPSGVDRRAPLVSFSSPLRLRRAAVLRRGISATIVSDETGTAMVRLVLVPPQPRAAAARPIVVGTAKKAVKAGIRSKVVVKLTKSGKAQLKKARRTVTLSLRVSVRDAAGNIRHVKPRVLTFKKR